MLESPFLGPFGIGKFGVALSFSSPVVIGSHRKAFETAAKKNRSPWRLFLVARAHSYPYNDLLAAAWESERFFFEPSSI
jgi:hypothetical protein